VIAAPTLEELEEARKRIASLIVRTPLIRLNIDDMEIFLKLENLQPIGSFKIRGAGNAILAAPRDVLAEGVWTASAGNMAQGVAWIARRLGIASTAVVPDHAPQTKLEAIERLEGKTIKVPFEQWWQILLTHRFEVLSGRFVHPVCDPLVIQGNGTIGLEILADVPDVDAILVPYGGGGLSTGIASAVRALKSHAKVYACEVETAAPLAASLAAGEPREVPYMPSFVDGIGGKSMLPAMWPLVKALIHSSLVVSLKQISAAIRLLAERNRVIAEGAGAASVAAALSGMAGRGKIVCVVSGGNIDPTKLSKILAGGTPDPPSPSGRGLG
jgi:threonine dehydratase